MKKTLLFIVLIFSFTLVWCQEDLLAEIDEEQEKSYVESSFKALQIVTSQSTKMAAKGDLYFVVSHRFGSLENGLSDFFGLDNASTKIGFIYGLNDWLDLSAARHTFGKTYELGAKYRLARQESNGSFPVNIVGFNTININSELDGDIFPNLEFNDRVSYLSQVLVSRKMNKRLSLQFMPSFVHQNLVNTSFQQDHSQFLLGSGGRFKVTDRMSINAEYHLNLNRGDAYVNPFSLGLDIETGGHVFQLLFTNSQAMTEVNYLTNGVGEWGQGDIYFGFNLYRVF